jgi:hypothetical protein
VLRLLDAYVQVLEKQKPGTLATVRGWTAKSFNVYGLEAVMSVETHRLLMGLPLYRNKLNFHNFIDSPDRRFFNDTWTKTIGNAIRHLGQTPLETGYAHHLSMSRGTTSHPYIGWYTIQGGVVAGDVKTRFRLRASGPQTAVSFKSILYDKYFSAVNGGFELLTVSSPTAGWKESFYIEDVNGGTLRSGDSIYISTALKHSYWCADWLGNRAQLNATRSVPDRWETFVITKLDAEGRPTEGEIGKNDFVTLLSFRGYVTGEATGTPTCTGGLNTRAMLKFEVW